ncbi:MAG TPA: MFS transporter [Candidatus Saccharimonadales bacterium]|nr:MFS transporter [Candidatus Saccharimonadales bacterium]
MLQEFKPVLKNKNFLYIWISQIFSQLTINIMNFVFLIRLFEVTGSAISTSLLWVAYALPAILIGPFASGAVDLVDRRKMLIITNLLQSLTIFLYAIAYKSNIFLLYEVVFVYSLINQFYVPAEAATLPSVLSKEKLAHGNSLFFITQQGSIVLGFAIAGLLNGLLGFNNTLFLCSFFLFIAFASTMLLPKLTPNNQIPKKFETAVFGFFRHIAEGYDYIKNDRKILTPFLLLIGFQAALQVAVVQVPIIAKNILYIPLNSAGVFILVPAGIGAILGALIMPKLLKKQFRKKQIINAALLTTGISIFVLAFIIPVFTASWVRVILAFISVLLLGLSFVGILVPSQTFLQESTPPDLRGRVFGNTWFLVTVASVVPVVFSGSLAEIFGIKFLLLILSLFAFGILFVSKRFGDRFLSG